ncbi:hypothetical protein F4820DRAFT_402177 [Hypoxylon rubiginosum]|uniref:Uncharacterized protein n=1 Tax=Hypoxylon rubiginosum TaxID=110542 RepID=A0ACB9ZH69_9PEZI|nr:hypothetical protein F4820DRAFT_402177 [Hypoxylon rubiginosum]
MSFIQDHAIMSSSITSGSSPAAPAAPAQLSPSPFRILDLPIELVLGVISFVDHGEAVLFSLTCKAARGVVFGASYGKSSLRALSLSDELAPFAKRLAFLELLAWDLPYHFVCRRCRKLHSHRRLLEVEAEAEDDPEDARPDPVVSHRRLDPARRGLLAFGPLWPQYAFSFDDARAALLGLGPGPGRPLALPIPQLAVSTGWKLARLGAACNNPDRLYGYAKLDAEAVWREGRLCFHKAQRVLVQPDKAEAFLRRSASSPLEHVFQPCPHASSLWSAFSQFDLFPAASYRRSRRPPCVRESVSLLADRLARRYGLDRACGPEGWDPLSIPDRVLPGCAFCATEAVLTVHNHGREGVEIVLDAYQDLGDCATAPPTRSTGNWLLCCSPESHLCYQNAAKRRRFHPAVDLSVFPTRAGKSAQKDGSAPSARDIWELHEHERRARLASAS